MKLKRIKKLMLQFMVLALATSLFAQSVRENFAAGNNGIPYRLAHFNAEKGGEPFLFVFLHGNSASGTDNEKQLEKDSLLHAVSYIERNGINALVLAPQSPAEKSWGALGGTVNALVSRIAAENGVPPARVFLMGESKGAVGVWSLAERYPDLAAKAVVMASNQPKSASKNLAKTEFFIIIGDSDTVGAEKGQKKSEAAANKVWKNEDFAAQLQAAGGEAHIMVLKDSDHQATAKNGLSDAVLDWLFGK